MTETSPMDGRLYEQPREQACEQPQLKGIELISGGWLNKYLLSYELPDGRMLSYEAVSRKNPERYAEELRFECGKPGREPERDPERDPERERAQEPSTPDALCIVPRTTDDELVMIKEFRYPLNSWCVAFPAGLVEPDESLESCLERELREETGYVLHLVDGKPSIRMLPQVGYSSTGMTDETIQIAYVLVERLEEPNLDPNEFIEVFTLPCGEVGEFLRSNRTAIGTRCQLILEALARDTAQAAL